MMSEICSRTCENLCGVVLYSCVLKSGLLMLGERSTIKLFSLFITRQSLTKLPRSKFNSIAKVDLKLVIFLSQPQSITSLELWPCITRSGLYVERGV